jgi:hypothetical protein
MLMRKTICRPVLIIFVFFVGGILPVCNSHNVYGGGISSTPDGRKIIPENELPQKILDALSGDPNAALALDRHYIGLDERLKWIIIGTENGAMEALYGLQIILLDSSNDFEDNTRGLYWLYRLVQVGYRFESTEARLGRNGHTLETAQPPGDSSFPDTYAQLSETEINECRIGALQGNRKAALLLGRYYSEITADNELSEYWYRIGAQNLSTECMYALGQILLRKDDRLDQVRGRFWLERATQNGYGGNV